MACRGCVCASIARMRARQSIERSCVRSSPVPAPTSCIFPSAPEQARAALAAAARTALDAAARELGRIEELCELLTRQIRHLFGHLADGPAFRIRFLGNG